MLRNLISLGFARNSASVILLWGERGVSRAFTVLQVLLSSVKTESTFGSEKTCDESHRSRGDFRRMCECSFLDTTLCHPPGTWLNHSTTTTLKHSSRVYLCIFLPGYAALREAILA
jgi:hypothetical protein